MEFYVGTSGWSYFWNLLWTEEIDLVVGISFKLIFLFILGMTALIFSAIILAFSRK